MIMNNDVYLNGSLQKPSKMLTIPGIVSIYVEKVM